MKLHGKRILITGAAGGLGTATMRALAAQGATVVGIDKRSPISETGDIIIADIREPQDVQRAVSEAVARLGGLDILINNAGVLHLQDAGLPPGADAAEVLAVNLLAPWRVAAAALPSLLASHGRIINVASLFAVVNAPLIPAYCASKRALAAYSDVLRMQYGDRLVVTTLYPGYMNTPIHAGAVRQGLSVARIVTFFAGGRPVLSLEESLARAARGVVRACSGRARDRGLTFLGTVTLSFARHVPTLVDAFVNWRINQLLKSGDLKIALDAPQDVAVT